MKAEKDNFDKQIISTKLKVVVILVLPLFFIGIYLTISAISIFRNTIIHWTIPFCIWFFTGLCILPFTYKFLNEPGKKSETFWQLFYNCIVFGGITYYFVMALNYNFPSANFKQQKIGIVEKVNSNNFRGCGPITRVKINGIKKDLVFKCGTNIDKAVGIDITTKNGLLGFDIIVEKRLMNE